MWEGLTYPCAILLDFFERMTITFESTFSTARERNIGIEEFPKLVRASLDQAI